MKKTLISSFAFIGLIISLTAQEYTDYIGAGHNVGITVSTSSSIPDAGPEKTIDGSGMESKYFAAGRFLNQATMGASKAEIDVLYENFNNNYEEWIDDQYSKPIEYLTPKLDSIWDFIYQRKINLGQDENDIFGPWTVHFNYSWWQVNALNQDKLRHKIAYALSQILVLSAQSDLNDHAEGLVYYYDLLLKHSFGNYKDLLRDVSYSLPMGYYLSHLNNPKEIPEENIHPDENYAREIMQLFTIGLYELNTDGTRKLDGSGNPIPTYDQEDIKEFAQVFTGLGPSGLEDYVWWAEAPYFGLDFWGAQKNTPMMMYQDFHDTSEKHLLNGYVLPAGQAGETDVDMAIDHLFNHPNVGPFISRQLIQRLVNSNPSPEYIGRVAAAFNDNGLGVRGDMMAVIKAILLDPEARDGAAMLEEEQGRLREPMLRTTNFGFGFGLLNNYGNYWHNGYDDLRETGQHVLSSPTVFNFYPPDYQPNGEIKDIGLVAPEFKLHNTAKAVTSLNRFFGTIFWDEHYFGGSWEYSPEPEDYPAFNDLEQSIIRLNVANLHPLSDTPELLINELDRIMTFGQLSDFTRGIIRNTILDIDWPWDREAQQSWRTAYAMYLIQFSPDYNIIK